MFEQFSSDLILYFLTYVVHSTLLLGIAYGLKRCGCLDVVHRRQLAENVWRLAFFAGFVTAAIQCSFVHPMALENDALEPEISSTRDLTVIPPTRVLGASEMLTSLPLTSQSNSQTIASPDQADRRLHIALPPAWHRFAPYVAIAWLVFALLSCVRLWWQISVLNRISNVKQDEVAGHRLHDLHRFVAQHYPRLRYKLVLIIGGDNLSPVVTPNSVICLPDAMLRQLDEKQQQAVLAHELSHVLRRDPLWKIAYNLVLRLFFFQPLNRFAYAELTVLTELACDAAAIKTTGHVQALAKALYLCAKQVHAHSLLMAASDSPSILEMRVRSLFDPLRVDAQSRKRVLRFVIVGYGFATLVILSVTIVATPAFQMSPMPLNPVSKNSQSISALRELTLVQAGDDSTNHQAVIATEKSVTADGEKYLREERLDTARIPSSIKTLATNSRTLQNQQDASQQSILVPDIVKTESPASLIQTQLRQQRLADIDYYVNGFQANELKLNREKCPVPEIPRASVIRSKNSETLQRINAWENCYNQFVELLQQRFEREPLVPLELANLMTDDELKRAKQRLIQTYQALAADAKRQLLPIQSEIVQWQAARERLEQIVTNSPMPGRQNSMNAKGVMLTSLNDPNGTLSSGTRNDNTLGTYVNGRPLGMSAEPQRVTDEFGWQHRGQTHAIDESTRSNSKEK